MTYSKQTAFPEPVVVWDLPLTPFTFDETLDAVDSLIATGRPHFFVTANLHYAMLTASDPRLRRVNQEAAFLVADGKPLILASRRTHRRLPERVTGADLVPALCERAALTGYGVFLLGGSPGVAEDASRALTARFPGLRIVGTEAPPFRPATAEEHAGLVVRIHQAKPDILFVAFGQPKGEFWLAEHYQGLGVPVCVQIGASLDFVAGRVKRAPRMVQAAGMEWAWRIGTDPRRLGPRYAADAAFVIKTLLAGRFGA